jgi:hypothetical protein
LVFEEPSGSYGICEVCGWEDDHVQLAYPGMAGGANKQSLADKQEAILRRYPLEVREINGIVRESGWRPVSVGEREPQPGQPQSGLAYFHSARMDTPEYYWRQKKSE